MVEKKQIKKDNKHKQQVKQEYLPCLHQRIAARLIKTYETEEKKKELIQLAAS